MKLIYIEKDQFGSFDRLILEESHSSYYDVVRQSGFVCFWHAGGVDIQNGEEPILYGDLTELGSQYFKKKVFADLMMKSVKDDPEFFIKILREQN